MEDFTPPFALSDAAGAHFQRIARQLYDAGRWASVAQDLVAVYAESLASFVECTRVIAAEGLMVDGRNRGAGTVRHPLLSPLNQTRQALVYLAKSIPLATNPHVERDHEFERWMQEIGE